MRGRRETIQCDYCGKDISVNGWLLDNMNTHFCDKECADNYKRENGKKGSDHPNYKSIETTCDNCGKSIVKKPSELKGKHKYCGKECSREHRATGIYAGDKNANWKGGLAEAECSVCGKPKKVKVYQLETTKDFYCSKECEKAHKAKRVGEKAFNWRGGIASLQTIIRKSNKYKAWILDIFERDEFTCQKCKCGSNKLHSHHIVGFSELLRSYNITTREEAMECEELWDTDNGATLCSACHSEFHKIYGRFDDTFTPDNYHEWINNIKIAA